MNAIVAGTCGILFGAGLALAGMMNPAKVLAFLDVFGAWDPSLAFVMAGALAVNVIGVRMAGGRAAPMLGGSFVLPTAKDLDLELLGGASLFGLGWGLVGICPGPALASIYRGESAVFLFGGAMLLGAFGFRLASRGWSTAETRAFPQ